MDPAWRGSGARGAAQVFGRGRRGCFPVADALGRIASVVEVYVARLQSSPDPGPIAAVANEVEDLKLGRNPDLIAEILRDTATPER